MNNLEIETLTVPKIFELFNSEGPEVEFIKYQILCEGLDGFHVTVKPNLSDEEKKLAVKETIRIWDDCNYYKEITELQTYRRSICAG